MPHLKRLIAIGLGLLFLAGAVLAFYLNAGTRVNLQVDGQRLTIATHASTVGAALAEAGVKLDPADRVRPTLDSPLNPAATIIVERAPLVSVAANGTTYLVRALAASPTGILATLGLSLGPGDVLLADGLPLSDTAQASPALPHTLALERAVDITITDGAAAPVAVRTAAPTVGEALWALGYYVYLGDEIRPAPDTAVTPSLAVTITRSRPVRVQADGRTLAVRTRAATVGEALSEIGLALVGEDYAVPAEEQPLPDSGQIEVVRVREEIITDQQIVPFDTKYQALANVEIDNLQQVQAGVPGVLRRLTRVRYENGVEKSRVAEGKTLVQNPVSEIIGYGTNIVVRSLATPDGAIEYWRSFSMYATSYAAKFTLRVPGTPTYGLTASGKILTKGLVAIDRNLMPFGTRMYVPGYGPAEAADIGSGVKGRFIDLGFDDWNFENWHWPVTVYFLTPVPPAGQIRWIIPSTVP